MGATGFGLTLAQQFNVPITATRPALVPLTFGDRDRPNMAALAGLSVDAVLSHQNTAFQEGMLFTHRGLSGPSVLQISSYWREGDRLNVDLHPSGDIFDILTAQKKINGKQAVQTALARILPRKLAEYVLRDCPVQGNLADQSNKGLQAVADRVHRWQVVPAGSEGYRTAEVMLGGVDTNALNAKTLEARTVPGLFFIGEVVDVTGWLGGYNFQWAWSSGWAAGQKA
jgi:predicted Rossmann fold flavoprotein